MVLIDVHRRNLRRRKRARQSKKEAAEMNVNNMVGANVGLAPVNDVFERKNSFTDQGPILQNLSLLAEVQSNFT